MRSSRRGAAVLLSGPVVLLVMVLVVLALARDPNREPAVEGAGDGASETRAAVPDASTTGVPDDGRLTFPDASTTGVPDDVRLAPYAVPAR